MSLYLFEHNQSEAYTKSVLSENQMIWIISEFYRPKHVRNLIL